jgi:hypothetical protein
VKPALAFIAALAISRAQIQLSITAIAPEATAKILDKSISKTLTLYLVTAENDGQEDVMLMESVVLKRMQQITEPLDHTLVQMLIAEGNRNSWQNRAGRAIADLAKIASVLTAGGIVSLGKVGLESATGAIAFGPYFMGRLQGIAPPIQSNYNMIAWTGPIILHHQETAIRYVFGANQRAKIQAGPNGSGSINYQFTIQTEGLKKIPVVQ